MSDRIQRLVEVTQRLADHTEKICEHVRDHVKGGSDLDEHTFTADMTLVVTEIALIIRYSKKEEDKDKD